MFDHVSIRVSNLEESRRFYGILFDTIGYAGPAYADDENSEWNDFSLGSAREDRPVTKHLHVAFVAPSRDVVDAFWRALTSAGYEDDGAPGPRPEYHDDYYGAFVSDPDGNSVEAVYHGRAREGGELVDHLWIGVDDLAASRRFYETIAPVVGLRLHATKDWRYHIAHGDRSSAFVQDGRPPTEHVHLAFAATDNATVDEFHRVALAAGYRDNGTPGERPEYHAGYYGAYVLDPDGNNVEAVNHNRG